MPENKRRSLNLREQKIILLYSSCELIMTPQEFYAKWPVTYGHLSLVCRKAESTVGKWFSTASQRKPGFNDLHHLGLVDFLLEYYEQIPEELKEVIFNQL